MKGNGGEFNLQRTQAALEAAGAKLECPSCGNRYWTKEARPAGVLVPNADDLKMEVAVREGGIPALPAFLLICKNCGFIRLHSTQHLLGEA